MTAEPTNPIHCKGTVNNSRCNALVCNMRGGDIVIAMPEDREMVVTFRRGGTVTCSKCDYRTVIGKVVAPERFELSNK